MACQQDAEKFEELVDAHYESIFRGAISVTRDKHLAEEIVQETFLAAFRKLESFAGRSSPFSWLYGIMLNKYRDHCRRNKLLGRLRIVRTSARSGQSNEPASRDPSACTELANSEESRLLMKAVNELPIKLRIVVAMRYFDGLPLTEVARILNCQVGTVKSRLSRARDRLANILQGKLA